MQIPAVNCPATIPAVIRHAAEAYGEREFIVMPDRRMTYAQAEAASRHLAKQLLAGGVGKGTRIGIMYGYGPDWVIAWLGVTRIGAICLPFSTSYKPPELRKALRQGDVDTLLIPSSLLGQDHEAFVEEAVPGLAGLTRGPFRIPALPYLRTIRVSDGARAAWAQPISLGFGGSTSAEGGDPVSEELLEAVESEVVPADLLISIFTSGTTSDPKGVVHTHGNFLRHGANLAAFQAITAEDRMFSAMPFFWIGGCCALNFALATGSVVLCIERFDAEVGLRLMEQEQATKLWMWPQLAQKLQHRIVASQWDVSNIPAFVAPPEGTPSTDDPELRHNSMGMTETVGPHSGPGPEVDRVLPEEMRGSFGLLVPGVEHRIADPTTNATLPEGEVGSCASGVTVSCMVCTRRSDTNHSTTMVGITRVTGAS